MRNKNKSFILIMLILLTLILSLVSISAQGKVTVKLNDIENSFTDAKPYLDVGVGRVLVPVRFVAESLDAHVDWDEVNRVVKISKFSENIELKLGEKSFMLNGIEKPMDVAAFIKDERTFVPLRFISESLGVEVEWDQNTQTVLLYDKTENREFVIQGICMGSTEGALISKLGEPNRKDLSKYGFEWYIYNNDYNRYIQVGIKNRRVVAIYSNSASWESKNGIKVGMKRADVENILGQSLEGVKKGNTTYLTNNMDEKGIYLIDDRYVSIFYDIYENNTVTAIHIIDKDTEHRLKGYYGNYNEELRDSFERQMFDIANSIRVRKGLEPFKWSDKAKISSRKHSKDMADNNYFAHDNLQGLSPFDRMSKEGLALILASENIAGGTSNAIESHEGLMNSIGHRVNILGEYKNLGIGVAYNANRQYKYYYTQNFFTEK